jgi:hypothetical protein
MLVHNEYAESIHLQTMKSRPESSKSWVSPFMKFKAEGSKPYAERRKEIVRVKNSAKKAY